MQSIIARLRQIRRVLCTRQGKSQRVAIFLELHLCQTARAVFKIVGFAVVFIQRKCPVAAVQPHGQIFGIGG